MECEYLSNPHWWFSKDSTTDEYISNKYSHLLDDKFIDDKSLEYILRYDQLPRHVYRNESANHIIQYFLQKALKHFEHIEPYLDQLDDTRFVFALLPLRHTYEPEQIYKALRLCWSRKTIGTIITRFIKAAYNRCPIVGLGPQSVLEDNFDRSILAFCPDVNSFQNNSLKGMNTMVKFQKKDIILSISGGVDSMVCSYLLRDKIKACVHINYSNRTTSDEEAKFVKWWCKQLNVPCYVRKIHEIKRSQCKQIGIRDVYEEYTRKVRFKCYEQMGENALIVLGHNKDDVLENIFTNISKMCKFDNLNGMEKESCNNGINFWRPLLDVTKNDIIQFAKDNAIPFLPNSTPSWSQRGQIRASIVPTIQAWDSNFISSVYKLSHVMQDMHQYIHQSCTTIIQNAIYHDNKNQHIELNLTDIPNIILFWKMLFTGLGIYGISSKSLQNALIHLLKNANKKKTIVLKHDTYFTIEPTCLHYKLNIYQN